MNDDCLKLTIYFGERDRVDGGFVADALSAVYARHELAASLVMRAVEGFGPKQQVRTDRLLTLSEDLPLVSVAVDTRARIKQALADVQALPMQGLVTLERARMLTSRIDSVVLPWDRAAETKLTVYVGRKERIDGRAAHEAVVELLHARGIAGATVLLGVDGTAHGVRERARFFGHNASVPLMIIAVGDTARIAAVASELSGLLARPLLTAERVRVCKRDGHRLAEPREFPEADDSGLRVWQKLMVYTGEQAQVDRQPLHQRLVRELRTEGAAGATSVRGIWGYHGDHRPHGDSFWQLRRRVPIVTVIIDTPQRSRRWFSIIDRLTEQTGLVTSEMVPAYHATVNGARHGGLRLARALATGAGH